MKFERQVFTPGFCKPSCLSSLGGLQDATERHPQIDISLTINTITSTTDIKQWENNKCEHNDCGRNNRGYSYQIDQ